MQFIRAPDENVYIAPLNLIEIVLSALFEWWMPKKWYEFINDCVMGLFYSPLLLIMAIFETRTAHAIRRNRARGEADDDIIEEWEQLAHDIDFGAEGWAKTCEAVKPNMEDDPAVVEIKKLRAELAGLKSMLADLGDHVHFPTSQDTKIGDGSAYEFKPSSETTHEETDHAPSTGKGVAHDAASSSGKAPAGSSFEELIDLVDDSAKPSKDSEEAAKPDEEETEPVEESTRPSEAVPEPESQDTSSKAPEVTPSKAPEDPSSETPEDTASKAPEDALFKPSEEAAVDSSEDAPTKTQDDVQPEDPEDVPFKAPEGAPLETSEYVPFVAPEDLPSEAAEGVPLETSEGAPLEETYAEAAAKAPEEAAPERVESEEVEGEDASPESPSGEGRAEGEQDPKPKAKRRRRKNKNKGSGSQAGPSGGS